MTRRGGRHKRSKRFQGESFGMPLADLLTTALGCMMLIFMVASTYMKDSLLEGEAAQSAMRTQLMDADERQRILEQLKAELSEELKGLKDALAQERAALQASQLAQATSARSAQELEAARLSLADELREARALINLRDQRLSSIKDQTRAALNYLDPKTARPVDVMLLIDGTKSMQPSLDSTRQNLKAVISALRIVSPTVRIGVTVYRDQKERPALRIEHQPLTEDERALKGFLSTIKAKSTRRDKDRAEWMCGGLKRAVSARWRKDAIKIIAIVSDAATQSKRAQRCVKLASDFKGAGGQVHVSSTLPEGYRKKREVTREYDEVVLQEHALIAAAGGGEHIKRADESTLLEAVLRSAFRARLAAPLKALHQSLDEPL